MMKNLSECLGFSFNGVSGTDIEEECSFGFSMSKMILLQLDDGSGKKSSI